MTIKLSDYIEQLEKEDESYIQNKNYQKELFEKYVLRNDSNREVREELFKAYGKGAVLTGPNGLRKKLAAIDLGYFGRAYLPHYFTRESPVFHEELDEIWTSGVMKGKNPIKQSKEMSRDKGCRRAIAAPRGHAKSTNFTFKDTLHSILYQ